MKQLFVISGLNLIANTAGVRATTTARVKRNGLHKESQLLTRRINRKFGEKAVLLFDAEGLLRGMCIPKKWISKTAFSVRGMKTVYRP